MQYEWKGMTQYYFDLGEKQFDTYILFIFTIMSSVLYTEDYGKIMPVVTRRKVQITCKTMLTQFWFSSHGKTCFVAYLNESFLLYLIHDNLKNFIFSPGQ